MVNNIQPTNAENTFFTILKAAMSVPGVQINRNDFLQKELSKRFDNDTVALSIEKNPASAGITTRKLEKIAQSCIRYECNKVSAISAVAGIPGGIAMLGTVPADTAQYFAHVIRILQKLIYLYGWQEIYNANGDFDDETLDQITVFMGIMFGVNIANATITKLAQNAALHAEKSIARKALTKGTIYPIVKRIAGIIGVKMTKDIFAKGVGKIIPVIGGLFSGSITYVTYRPLAVRLKNHLRTLAPADVEFYKQEHNDVIELNFNDIVIYDSE